MIFILGIVGIIFIGYGALLFCGKWTPVSKKMLVEEEFFQAWSRMDGLSKIVWGIVLILVLLYLIGFLLPILWGIAAAVLSVWNIRFTVNNNRKYMK